MKAQKFIAGLGALAIFFISAGSAIAATPEISSSSFLNNGVIPSLHGGTAGDCGGQGVSPQIAWSKLPAGSKSIAVLAFDPDGAKGLGASHWVAYNIAAERGQLKQGEGQIDGAGATVGKNVAGVTAFRGMCPLVGDAPHPYVFTVIATDLEPTALPAGLSRDELLAALKGHALGGHSIVGYYAR